MAREYQRVATVDELMSAVREARLAKRKYFVLAGGSNVVMPENYRGRVIHYHVPQDSILKTKIQDRTLTVEAGVRLMDFINYAIDCGLAGIETLSGIPGTVGGAIVGNAGAYGQTISDTLVRVKIFDPTSLKLRGASGVKWLSKRQCHFAYRESIFKQKDWLVLEAEFTLKPGNKSELEKKSQEIIAVRNQRYTPGLKCPGSFFKNVLVKSLSRRVLDMVDPAKIVYPEQGRGSDGKIPAGYLLEEVGAKGLKLGNLRVADFHGNLIINNGKATMGEVKKLAALLKRRVFKKFGIKLEEEVRYVG